MTIVPIDTVVKIIIKSIKSGDNLLQQQLYFKLKGRPFQQYKFKFTFDVQQFSFTTRTIGGIGFNIVFCCVVFDKTRSWLNPFEKSLANKVIKKP